MGFVGLVGLHNSLVCIEFWHKFLDYDLAINFLKFLAINFLKFVLPLEFTTDK